MFIGQGSNELAAGSALFQCPDARKTGQNPLFILTCESRLVFDILLNSGLSPQQRVDYLIIFYL
jgi:hypothetical protein